MLDFIDRHRAEYGVEPICTVLPVVPSTYYTHKARKADPARLLGSIGHVPPVEMEMAYHRQQAESAMAA